MILKFIILGDFRLMKRVIFTPCIIVIFLCITGVAYCSSQQVRIEFLYHDKFCQYCPEIIEEYVAYVHNRDVLANIQRDYGEKVIIEYISFFSEEGLKRVKQYGLSLRDWNVIIVNGKIILGGGKKCVNETVLREIIDSQLVGLNQEEIRRYAGLGIMASAFVLGFFESFSPCVLIMLSFIVGYASSERSGFQMREGFLKVMVFGISFILASVILSYTFNMFLSMAALKLYLTLATCLLAIIFGLNLVGLLRLPEHSKSLMRRAAKKYAISYAKIFLLGVIFYYLDPCVAPVFVSLTTALFSETFSFALLLFCIGALIPFIGAGLLAGSLSKISREAYKHRTLIRGISGAILMGYALYILFHVITMLL